MRRLFAVRYNQRTLLGSRAVAGRRQGPKLLRQGSSRRESTIGSDNAESREIYLQRQRDWIYRFLERSAFSSCLGEPPIIGYDFLPLNINL